MKIYDLIIIGAGPSGIVAALIAGKKGLSVLLLEKGKNLAHRKSIVSGWFGYGIFNPEKADTSNIKNKRKLINIIEKATSQRLSLKDNISLPSNFGNKLANYFTKIQDIDISFNVEVDSISLNKGNFTVCSAEKKFTSKRCIVANGNHSVSLIKSLCDLGIVNQDSVSIGVKLEFPNRKSFKLENSLVNSYVGSWEEADVISSVSYFIPNKKSGKVNYLLSTKNTLNEIIRISQIISVLSNGKTKIEKVSDFFDGKSILKHFDFIKENSFGGVKSVPNIENATVHIPEIQLLDLICVDSKLQTKIPNLYGIGHCTGHVHNILESMDSGITVIDQF